MKKTNLKKVSVLVGIIMMFTMIFGSSNVFAYGGHPPLGELKRIEPSSTYVLLEEGEESFVSIVAYHERGGCYVNTACDWSVDHENVIEVEDGKIIAKQKGVATITAKFLTGQTQITVEVK